MAAVTKMSPKKSIGRNTIEKAISNSDLKQYSQQIKTPAKVNKPQQTESKTSAKKPSQFSPRGLKSPTTTKHNSESKTKQIKSPSSKILPIFQVDKYKKQPPKMFPNK